MNWQFTSGLIQRFWFGWNMWSFACFVMEKDSKSFPKTGWDTRFSTSSLLKLWHFRIVASRAM